MKFKGSDAAVRKGVYYVISDLDHPAAKLLQSPLKISRGMTSSIGLSLKKERFIVFLKKKIIR
jgi:hypothetical protein